MKPLPVYGAGLNVRDWLYVEDHARALDLIVAHGRIGEKYNVGGRNERRNIDVVRRVCAILDRLRPMKRPYESLISFVTDRPGHDLRYAIDATKLERELGWRALETFDSGVEKTVRWYLDNEWWWRPLRDKVYAGERLGVIAEEAGQTLGAVAGLKIGAGDNRELFGDEGHHSGGRRGNASASDHLGGLQAARPRLRQADDLLSAVGRHARGIRESSSSRPRMTCPCSGVCSATARIGAFASNTPSSPSPTGSRRLS